MSQLQAQAMSGYFLRRGFRRAALMILVGYHCLLRTKELLCLRTTDITMHRKGAHLILRDTKMGQRVGIDENATINDTFITEALRSELPAIQIGATVVGITASKFRHVWKDGLLQLGLPETMTPYAIRRGAATQLFQLTGKFDLVANAGRWSTVAALRIYVTTALAESAQWANDAKADKFSQKYAKLIACH